ncbi:MAG TPA: type 4a pilus biogenesis protein PilO [Pilimelia sp.]|nr:type 4a pilus biogenesis protein PilO [Pilimelia sp.]
MRTTLTARLWLAGGALAAVLLVVTGWFLLVSPKLADAAGLRTQADDVRMQVDLLNRELATLREQNRDLAGYEAKLAAARQALPHHAALPDLLRQLQAAGEAAGVTVGNLTVGGPAEVNGASTEVIAVPVSLTAVGTGPALERFLDQLQRHQPRAMLIDSVASSGEGADASLAGRSSLTLGLRVFVAPAFSPPAAGR